MTQDEFIAQLFCRVDDALHALKESPDLNVPKDPRAKLWPSELVTLGILFALRGQSQRRFYNWLCCNFRPLFPHLPERTRLFRLLRHHQSLADHFLAQPSLINIGDSFGIELIHPRREARSPQQIGKKGKSNNRWIVGVKFCPLLNGSGRIADWDADTANVHDSDFQRMLSDPKHQAVGKMTDKGFHRSTKRGGDCAGLMVCERGQCNFRMIVETVFSNLTRLFSLKKITERTWPAVEARLAFVCAAWNLLAEWASQLQLSGKDRTSISMAWIPL